MPERMADPEYQRRLMCYVVLIAVAAVCAVFIPLNYWVFDHPLLVVAQIVVAVACVGMTVYLYRTDNVAPTALLAVLLLAMLFLIFVWEARAAAPTLALAALFPGVAFYLLGNRRGLLAVMVFFPLAVWSF
ncbi:MAG: hypothetical protein JJT95_17930, partial [Pararhodobacter sp.]|nr:hypothetical protein [Pararhodobacter sp.]